MNNNGGNYIKISENRDHTIDALRGLGIILVMLGHLNPDEYILKYIYSFHMFLFFFISGFLAHRRTDTFWHYTVIRFNRLLIPFFFWNCASLCIDAVWLHNSDCSNYFMQLFFLRGAVSWNSPVWFLAVSFWLDIVLFGLMKTGRGVRWITICLCSGIWAVISSRGKVLPFGLHILPIAIVFALLGQEYKVFDIETSLSKRSKYALIVIALLVNILLGVTCSDLISVYHMKYTNYLFVIFSGLMGILFWMILIGELVALKKGLILLEEYGRHTILILCTHYWIYLIMQIIGGKWYGVDLWHMKSTPKALAIWIIVCSIYWMVFKVYDILAAKYRGIRYVLG